MIAKTRRADSCWFMVQCHHLHSFTRSPMKTKVLFFTLSCLLLLSVIAHAQPGGMPNFAQMRQSPMMQRTMEMGMKTGIRSFWDGRGTNLMALGLLQDPDVRAALNVSDEQFQHIQGIPMNMQGSLMTNPEFQEAIQEMQALQIQGNPFAQDLDEETMNKFASVQARIGALTVNAMSDAIGNALTSEQQQKMLEGQLAMMGEMPIVSPNMFEALNLSDAQRQQMEGIKNELEPEFERHLEDFASGQMIVMNKMFDEIERQGGFNTANTQDPEGMRENMRAIQERAQSATQKLMAEDPEFKRIAEELQSKGKAFATQFQIKMFDVLTDEQWARLQDLIDNPPEYARVLLRKMKEQRGETERARASSGGWQPGPDSWKPGDPIPEAYRQQRNERRNFPRPGN